MRMTKNRKQILSLLSTFDEDSPPYTASYVSRALDVPLANVCRTLDDLVALGLVVKEPRKIYVYGKEGSDCVGAIQKTDYTRDGYVFWNAQTMDDDIARKCATADAIWKKFEQLLING